MTSSGRNYSFGRVAALLLQSRIYPHPALISLTRDAGLLLADRTAISRHH
jgi:hypothetical protein